MQQLSADFLKLFPPELPNLLLDAHEMKDHMMDLALHFDTEDDNEDDDPLNKLRYSRLADLYICNSCSYNNIVPIQRQMRSR